VLYEKSFGPNLIGPNDRSQNSLELTKIGRKMALSDTSFREFVTECIVLSIRAPKFNCRVTQVLTNVCIILKISDFQACENRPKKVGQYEILREIN
jgi:hypothetical protein